MVQVLKRKHVGGNVILKVDMAKAYDRVDLKFLNQGLKGFGFYNKVCKLISECLEKSWFSIKMNAM